MKLHAITLSSRCSAAGMGLDLAGIDYDLVFHALGTLKDALKDLNPNAKVPTLETPEGSLFETHAILRHAARTSGKLYGENAFQASQIDQWLDWVNCDLQTLAPQFLYQLFGFEFPGLSYEKSSLFKAKSLFQGKLKIVNKALEGRDWLVGSDVSIADVALLNCTIHYLTFFAGDKERKGYKNITAWLERFSQLAAFKKWFGRLRLTPNAYSWFKTEAGAPAPKKQEKKQKKKPQQQVAKKPAKPKYEFPKSDFNLMSFKTEFINNADIPAALEKFWKDFDSNAWSLWHLKYIKYKGECEEVYRTNNLLRGFLDRCNHMGKHLFGVHGVIGDEPSLYIQGVWMVHGLEIFPDLKEHDQFDCYEWIKLDHTKPEDRAILESVWSARVEDEDKMNGHTLRTFKWVK